MSRAASSRQIGAIHALKNRAGLDDECYRDLVEAETGKRSSKELTIAEAVRVIDRLKGLSGGARRGIDDASNDGALARVGLDGPYAKKLQALWISAWHLGLAASRRDAALLAFVRRQTGIDHTRWLREAKDAARAIEGLKAWLARERGVRWSDHPNHPQLAVVEAQERYLGVPSPLHRKRGSLKARMMELGEVIRGRRA